MDDLETHNGTVEAQRRYYEAKLQYEIDPWDLNQAIQAGESIVVVDTRGPKTYARRHVAGSITQCQPSFGLLSFGHTSFMIAFSL